jgi:hypothetical protein
MKPRALIIAVVLLLISGADAIAGSDNSSTMRCGTRIVTIGESRYTVRAKCGPPSQKDVRHEKRIARDTYRDLFPSQGNSKNREQEKYREPLFVEENVEIEEWTYNLGPTSFIRYLYFENGKLVQIETGDYGF